MTSHLPPGGKDPIWTPKTLLDWSTGYFGEKGLDSPRLDSELLLSHVLDCQRIDLYLQFDRPLTPAELSAFRNMVQKRAGRTPVAYLTGEAGFWNLTLAIRPGVLVPRPETELVVEEALEAISAIRKNSGKAEDVLLLLEVGTGSSAIPLAISSECQGLWWVATDLSGEALAVAAENRRRYANLLNPRHNSLHLLRGVDISPFSPGFQPDLIISNPPYIPSDEIAGLEPEVSRAEPGLALDGGPDGLNLHRILLDYGCKALSPGGRIILEIGHDQGEKAREELSRRSELGLVRIAKDLGGRDRVLHAEKRRLNNDNGNRV